MFYLLVYFKIELEIAVNSYKAKKKIMSVSSDMSKNIRVGRSEKSFFLFSFFF